MTNNQPKTPTDVEVSSRQELGNNPIIAPTPDTIEDIKSMLPEAGQRANERQADTKSDEVDPTNTPMKHLDGITRKPTIGCPKCHGTHHPMLDCAKPIDLVTHVWMGRFYAGEGEDIYAQLAKSKEAHQ